MVLNWKFISWFVGVVIALICSLYLNFGAWKSNVALREKLLDYQQTNKDLKIAYEEELAERERLLKVRSNLMKRFDNENKDNECYNSVIPDNIINGLSK